MLREPIEVSSGVIYSAGVDEAVRSNFITGTSAPIYHILIFEASFSDFVWGGSPKLMQLVAHDLLLIFHGPWATTTVSVMRFE
jgi:hypothetical protein